MVHFPQIIFFGKIITIILIYLLAPFIMQNLKKSYEGVQILGQNGRFPQMGIFFRKPFNDT